MTLDDAPSLQEALEVDGPRPLKIAEYRARQQKRTKPNKKIGVKRWLAKELIKTERQQYTKPS